MRRRRPHLRRGGGGGVHPLHPPPRSAPDSPSHNHCRGEKKILELAHVVCRLGIVLKILEYHQVREVVQMKLLTENLM